MPLTINERTLTHPLRRQLFTFFAPKLGFKEITSPWQKLFYDASREKMIFEIAIQRFENTQSQSQNIQAEIAWLEYMMQYSHYFIARLFFKEKYIIFPEYSATLNKKIELLFNNFTKKISDEVDKICEYLSDNYHDIEKLKLEVFIPFLTMFTLDNNKEVKKRFKDSFITDDNVLERHLEKTDFELFFNYILSSEIRRHCHQKKDLLKEIFKSSYGVIPSEAFSSDFELAQIFFSKFLSQAHVALNKIFKNSKTGFDLLTLKLNDSDTHIQFPGITAAHRYLIQLAIICHTPQSLTIACRTFRLISKTHHLDRHPELQIFLRKQLDNIIRMRGILVSLYGSAGMLILSVASSLEYYLENSNKDHYEKTFLYLALAMQLRDLCHKNIDCEFSLMEKLQTLIDALSIMFLDEELSILENSSHYKALLIVLDTAQEKPIDYIEESFKARSTRLKAALIALEAAQEEPIDYIGEFLKARSTGLALECQESFNPDTPAISYFRCNPN